MREVEEIPHLSHRSPAFLTQWAPRLHWDTISPWPRVWGSLETRETFLQLEVQQNGAVLLLSVIPGFVYFYTIQPVSKDVAQSALC